MRADDAESRGSTSGTARGTRRRRRGWRRRPAFPDAPTPWPMRARAEQLDGVDDLLGAAQLAGVGHGQQAGAAGRCGTRCGTPTPAAAARRWPARSRRRRRPRAPPPGGPARPPAYGVWARSAATTHPTPTPWRAEAPPAGVEQAGEHLDRIGQLRASALAYSAGFVVISTHRVPQAASSSTISSTSRARWAGVRTRAEAAS